MPRITLSETQSVPESLTTSRCENDYSIDAARQKTAERQYSFLCNGQSEPNNAHGVTVLDESTDNSGSAPVTLTASLHNQHTPTCNVVSGVGVLPRELLQTINPTQNETSLSCMSQSKSITSPFVSSDQQRSAGVSLAVIRSSTEITSLSTTFTDHETNLLYSQGDLPAYSVDIQSAEWLPNGPSDYAVVSENMLKTSNTFINKKLLVATGQINDLSRSESKNSFIMMKNNQTSMRQSIADKKRNNSSKQHVEAIRDVVSSTSEPRLRCLESCRQEYQPSSPSLGLANLRPFPSTIKNVKTFCSSFNRQPENQFYPKTELLAMSVVYPKARESCRKISTVHKNGGKCSYFSKRSKNLSVHDILKAAQSCKWDIVFVALGHSISVKVTSDLRSYESVDNLNESVNNLNESDTSEDLLGALWDDLSKSRFSHKDKVNIAVLFPSVNYKCMKPTFMTSSNIHSIVRHAIDDGRLRTIVLVLGFIKYSRRNMVKHYHFPNPMMNYDCYRYIIQIIISETGLKDEHPAALLKSAYFTDDILINRTKRKKHIQGILSARGSPNFNILSELASTFINWSCKYDCSAKLQNDAKIRATVEIMEDFDVQNETYMNTLQGKFDSFCENDMQSYCTWHDILVEYLTQKEHLPLLLCVVNHNRLSQVQLTKVMRVAKKQKAWALFSIGLEKVTQPIVYLDREHLFGTALKHCIPRLLPHCLHGQQAILNEKDCKGFTFIHVALIKWLNAGLAKEQSFFRISNCTNEHVTKNNHETLPDLHYSNGLCCSNAKDNNLRKSIEHKRSNNCMIKCYSSSQDLSESRTEAYENNMSEQHEDEDSFLPFNTVVVDEKGVHVYDEQQTIKNCRQDKSLNSGCLPSNEYQRKSSQNVSASLDTNSFNTAMEFTDADYDRLKYAMNIGAENTSESEMEVIINGANVTGDIQEETSDEPHLASHILNPLVSTDYYSYFERDADDLAIYNHSNIAQLSITNNGCLDYYVNERDRNYRRNRNNYQLKYLSLINDLLRNGANPCIPFPSGRSVFAAIVDAESLSNQRRMQVLAHAALTAHKNSRGLIDWQGSESRILFIVCQYGGRAQAAFLLKILLQFHCATHHFIYGDYTALDIIIFSENTNFQEKKQLLDVALRFTTLLHVHINFKLMKQRDDHEYKDVNYPLKRLIDCVAKNQKWFDLIVQLTKSKIKVFTDIELDLAERFTDYDKLLSKGLHYEVHYILNLTCSNEYKNSKAMSFDNFDGS